MIEWIVKYRFRRKGLLITWDWGYAKEALAPKEAHANGLVLFRNRWVTPEARQRIIKELRIFRLVRLLAVLVILQSLAILADVLLWNLFSTTVDVLVSISLMALALGLWCFKPIAWAPAIVYACLVTGVGAYGLFSTAAAVSGPLALASEVGASVLFLAYVCLVWFVLLNKTARKIFS